MTGPGNDAPLDTSAERYFREAYEDVMYTGTVGVYSRMVHALMEKRFRRAHSPIILEVGAGAGQHAAHVAGTWDTYWETDVDGDLGRLGDREVNGKPVTRVVADAQDLAQFPDASVDRVIATCLLAHLDDPERALTEWRRVTKPGGWVTIYVPTEPGMLLRLLRTCIMVPKSRKYGQDHLRTVYRDHRNHYPSMRIMIDDVFAGDRVYRRRFPTRFVGWNFAMFDIVDVQVNS